MKTLLKPSFSQRLRENECYCACASAPPLGQKLWIRLWQFPGAEAMVKLYHALSLLLSLCHNSLWGTPDASTALWSIVSQSLFSPALLLSGCVRLLQKPFCILPCVYMPFPLSRLLLISFKSLSDALNICGTQKHLHARSASVFWQASTSFELHFDSSHRHMIMPLQRGRLWMATSPSAVVLIAGRTPSLCQYRFSKPVPAVLSFRFFRLSTKTHSWGSTNAAGDACKWAVGH